MSSSIPLGAENFDPGFGTTIVSQLAKAAHYIDQFDLCKVNEEKCNLNPRIIAIIKALPTVRGVLPDNPVTVKDWHKRFTHSIRYHLVQRIAQGIITRNISNLEDSTLTKLVDYSRKLEAFIYDTANSPDEFQIKIVNHIENLKFKKALLEKQQKHKERLLQVGPDTALMIDSGTQSPNMTVKKEVIHKIEEEEEKNIDDRSASKKRIRNDAEGSSDALPAKRRSELEGPTGFELEPYKILNSRINSSGELMYNVKWKGSDETDWVLSQTANFKYPQIVIKFYEEKSASSGQ